MGLKVSATALNLKKMDRKILILVLAVSLLLVSCQQAVEQTLIKNIGEVQKAETEVVPGETCAGPNVLIGGDCCLDENNNEICDSQEDEEKVYCEKTSDCEEGLLCIDRECGLIAELYETDCENKCKITSVEVLTSDDEIYTLKLGQGSYSYAGALEWRLLSTPEYCPGDEPLVPIRLIKKSYGEILEKQVITLHKGETSGVITHPTVKGVKFTAKLQDVVEECS